MQRPSSAGSLLRSPANNAYHTSQSVADFEEFTTVHFRETASKTPSPVNYDPLFDESPPGKKISKKGSYDPLFDDDVRVSSEEETCSGDTVIFFDSYQKPSSTSEYTFTWRGWWRHFFEEQKYFSVAAIIVSFVLFYIYFTMAHSEEIHSTGDSWMIFFAAHYAMGVMAGLVIVIVSFITKKRPPTEPLIILAAVLWSLYPDVLYALYNIPHQPWMTIFFFHPQIDLWPGSSLLILIFLNATLAFVYARLIEKSHPKTSTNNLVALL